MGATFTVYVPAAPVRRSPAPEASGAASMSGAAVHRSAEAPAVAGASSSSRTSRTSCAGSATRWSSRASRWCRPVWGARACGSLRERGADCVLLDLMLPDVNGYQVCEEIRATNPLVPDHHADRARAGDRQDPRPRGRAPTTTSPSPSRSASWWRASRPSSAACSGPAPRDEEIADRRRPSWIRSKHELTRKGKAMRAVVLRGRAARACCASGPASRSRATRSSRRSGACRATPPTAPSTTSS